jgi:hypothetical protein
VEIIINGEKYISTEDVLKILEIKEYKLQEKIKNKEISPPLRPAPRAFWRRDEIEDYKKRMESTRKEPE